MSNPLSPPFHSLHANGPEAEETGSITVEEISDAAEALREVEMEAARGELPTDTRAERNSSAPVEEEFMIQANLRELSIDELVGVAMKAARGELQTDTRAECNSSAPVEVEFMIPVNLSELSIEEFRDVASMLNIRNDT